MPDNQRTGNQHTGNQAADSGEPQVRAAPERHRYEVTVEGELAGHVDYVDSGDQRIFHHTEIDDRFSGQGLGGRLVSAALADARDDGHRIVAVCPFVDRYVTSHPDYNDIVDPVTPAVLDTVSAATQG